MIGISLYGGYVPRYRLDRMTVFGAMGWLNPATMMNAAGEKAVANFDEDSITMASAAGIDCLEDFDRREIDGVYLATTTASFKERQNANIVAGALCLEDGIRTADFSGSLKSGTSALLSAIEHVGFHGNGNILVSAADCRLAKMGSAQEMFFGDAAAAFLVSDKDVIAEYKGSYSAAHDFVDHLRGANSKYDRQWEERWVRDLGYETFIPEAIEGICRKYSLTPNDFSKIIYPCCYPGARKKINKKIGLEAEKIQDELQASVGDSGAAHSLLMLASALETAEPGEKLLLIGYGNGYDALYLEVTENIKKLNNRAKVSACLSRRAELDKYTKYLIWRDMAPADVGMRGEEDKLIRWSLVWRNRKGIQGLQGVKCNSCGTQQYPPQRICVNPECGSVDDFEPVYLAGKGGKIFSYTSDMLASSINPPAIYGNIDINGGGRALMDFTDCSLDDLEVGKEVNFSLRIKFYDEKRDTTFYFWKAVPVSGEVS